MKHGEGEPKALLETIHSPNNPVRGKAFHSLIPIRVQSVFHPWLKVSLLKTQRLALDTRSLHTPPVAQRTELISHRHA